MTKALLTQQTITVKTYDVDFASIVHNMVYIRWLEDLRTAMLADVYPIASMIADGVSPILTETKIAYRHPARLGDTVRGEMWVAQLGRTRWTVEAALHVGKTAVATATQRGYFANMEMLRPVRIPAPLQAAWNAAR